MIRFNIVTLFPEFFASPLACGIMGRAQKAGLIQIQFHNPRDFSSSPHRHVDDRPFGGGVGMVMQLEPLALALRSIADPGPLCLLTPAGRQFDQAMAKNLCLEESLTLICGRYEGIDARLAQLFPLQEISLCPAILNGGEAAALAMMESVARLAPGVLGKLESTQEESFADGLLEYPHYTRPESYENTRVPEILLGGHHANIALWRRHQALTRTFTQNSELLSRARLTAEDIVYLADLPRLRASRNISFCLCHAPVRLGDGQIGASSLTNLDVHDIARISQSYKMGPFYIYTPLADQLRLLQNIISHWTAAQLGPSHADRQAALKNIESVASFGELEDRARAHFGTSPLYVLTSALIPGHKDSAALTAEDIRSMSKERPVVVLLGTARGLEAESIPLPVARMRPIRFLDVNHLPVRAAAAIIADRIIGDFN